MTDEYLQLFLRSCGEPCQSFKLRPRHDREAGEGWGEGRKYVRESHAGFVSGGSADEWITLQRSEQAAGILSAFPRRHVCEEVLPSNHVTCSIYTHVCLDPNKRLVDSLHPTWNN